MNLPIPKTPRIVAMDLKKLMEKVCELDGNECRNPYCYSWRVNANKRGWFAKMGGVFLDPPHHIILKSQGGDDSVENLILLCNVCHRFMHQGMNHRHMGRMSALKCAVVMLDVLKLKEDFRHEKPLGQLLLNLSRKEPATVEEPA